MLSGCSVFASLLELAPTGNVRLAAHGQVAEGQKAGPTVLTVTMQSKKFALPRPSPRGEGDDLAELQCASKRTSVHGEGEHFSN